MRRLARAVWHDLPRLTGRMSRTVGVSLADGQYLAAWSPVAVLAPVAAFLGGAVVAARQEEVTFTYEVWALVVFAVCAGAGAGLGCWTLLGYVAVDVVAGDRDRYSPATESVLLSAGASAIEYLLLATLLALVPLTTLGLREELVRFLRAGAAVVRPVTHVLLFGAFTYAWAQATAFLIRPVWSFHDGVPDVAAIEPLQLGFWPFVLGGMAAAASRGVLEGLALRRPPPWMEVPPVDLTRPRRLPVWVAVPLRSLFLCVLLAGLIASLLEAVVLFAALLCPLAVQATSARAKPIAWLADRIPLVVRVAVAGVAAYLLATVELEPWIRTTSSFIPMLTSVTVALTVAALLLPQREV